MGVCKWCGDNFDNRSGMNAGGWYVCSERCRTAQIDSINKGESRYNPNAITPDMFRTIGKFILFSVLLIIGALFLDWCSSLFRHNGSSSTSIEQTSGQGADGGEQTNSNGGEQPTIQEDESTSETNQSGNLEQTGGAEEIVAPEPVVTESAETEPGTTDAGLTSSETGIGEETAQDSAK